VTIIDRHIIARFFTNFVILFVLLFVFAVAIDLILNLDKFVDAARTLAGADASALRIAIRLVGVIVNFEGPRIFQFFAYLNGLTAVGAMGFTLAQMIRHRELVAVMASGVSLYRLAMPFIVAVFILSVLQLLNQELVLPRVASLLLRDHSRIGEAGLERFEITFTPDGAGNLLQAPLFDPESGTLTAPTFLQRDSAGRTVQRVSAARATWSEEDAAWRLDDGVAVRLREPWDSQEAQEPAADSAESLTDAAAPTTTASTQASAGDATTPAVILSQVISEFPTDLTPQVLMVRQHAQFASMLSLGQIRDMLQTPRVPDRETLLRYRYSRFSSILVNLLVLWLTLPCFLLREPANLLRQSIMAASLAIPATVGSAIGMMVSLPGIAPAASVFLPVVVLMFMCLFPWTFFKT
jgi:lipopolysaccharide export LptBFGC system permease protein LptF